MKRIHKILVFFLIELLLLSLAGAQNGADIDDATLRENFESNPDALFGANPERAWQLLGNSPQLMTTPAILSAAFGADPLRAAGVIDKNVFLLDNSEVARQFELAAVSDVNILNANVFAKEEWLDKRYGIDMVYSRTEVQNFDGQTITMGDSRTTFTLSDVPDAMILQDGCLQLTGTTFCGTKQLSYARSPESNQIYETGLKKNYHIAGGAVTLEESDSEMYLFIENSKVLMKKGGGEVEYSGSFRLATSRAGTLIASQGCALICSEGNTVLRTSQLKTGEGKIPVPLQISGSILIPPDARQEEFIIQGSSTLRFLSGGGMISTQSDSQIYYTGEKDREREEFCQQGFSCIVNRPGYNVEDPRYRELLLLRDVQRGDVITVSSRSYYDKVEVMNPEGGEVRYISISEDGRTESEVAVGPDGKARVRGDLSMTNAGRFDVFKTKEGSTTLQHWSSVREQKEVPAFYFRRSDQRFVTCTADVDCEQKFAEAFGRVVGPRGKTPETTIIIAGDYASVARSMEHSAECQKRGCYILNSRDMPPETESKNLIITGHHFSDSQIIWRDAPYVGKDDSHHPIDAIYLNTLPEGPVESIVLSACNTVKKKTYPGVDALADNYPELKVIQGWDETAPPFESIERVVNVDDIAEKNLPLAYVGEKGLAKGRRAWYIKVDDRWLWTTDGEQCRSMASGRESSCVPPAVAVAGITPAGQ